MYAVIVFRDDHRGYAWGVFRSVDDDHRRSALHRFGDEVVAVESLPVQRDERVARLERPRVGD